MSAFNFPPIEMGDKITNGNDGNGDDDRFDDN